jgi:hypothetical protein
MAGWLTAGPAVDGKIAAIVRKIFCRIGFLFLAMTSTQI